MSNLEKAIKKLIEGEEEQKDVRYSVSFSEEENKRIENVLSRIESTKQKFIHTIVMAVIEDIESKESARLNKKEGL